MIVDDSTLVGGEMQYALSADAATAPEASAYTTAIPSATDAGTYYVWYKAVNSENQLEIAPECVTVTIGKAGNSLQVSITGWSVDKNASIPSANAVYGSDLVKYVYSTSPDDIYTEEVPTEAGIYYMKAIIEATDNYEAAESDPVQFEITANAAPEEEQPAEQTNDEPAPAVEQPAGQNNTAEQPVNQTIIPDKQTAPVTGDREHVLEVFMLLMAGILAVACVNFKIKTKEE